MAGYDKYIIVVCLIVFIALTAMFAVLITSIIKMRLKVIKGGLADSEILKQEQQVKKAKHTHAARSIVNKILSIFFCTLMLLVFWLSIGTRIVSSNKVGDTPIVKVVKSGSMATIYEKNEYIAKNNLTNQIKKYDLITLFKLPEENDLKVYDVVMYETNGICVIHRIVAIEEPDEKHDERYFLLQGDANQYPDKFPVKYSQMLGIYKNNRVPYVGSFVDFMQSPVGYLCILLIVFSCVISPIADKKLDKAIEERKIKLALLNNKLSFFKSTFSKDVVADYMENTHKNKLIVNRTRGTSKTRLMFPDTYYVSLKDKNKCFAYVYRAKNGDAILRVIGDENLKSKYEGMKKTLFPKQIDEQWYVIRVNDKLEFASETIINILDYAFEKASSKEVKQYENN